METLFRREVRSIAGHSRPIKCRAVDGVVARHALHACQLAAHVVLYVFQSLRIVAPRHDVEVRPHRGQPVGVRLVQVAVYPLAVDAVAPRIARERLHIPCGLLEFLEVLLAVVDNHVLVVDVVAGEQQPHRGGEGEAAVRAVGGEFLIPGVGSHRAGQVFRVGQGVQAQAVVADAHLPCREVDVLQCGVAFGHEREVTLYQSGFAVRPHNLVGGEASQPDEAAVVDDALELFRCLHELRGGFLVKHLRDDMPPAQRAEIALHPVTLLRRLGQVEVARVLQVRTLVEVTLEAP